MSSLVVLAVVDGPVPEGVGLAGDAGVDAGVAGVRVLSVGRLRAAVREVASPPPVEPEALRHQDALVRALAARWEAILPFRFGTLVEGEEALARALAPVEALLRDGLERVRGKEQWTLRVHGAPAEAAPDLTPDSNGISRSRAGEPEGLAPGPSKGISPWRSAEGTGGSPDALGPGARYLAERARIRSAAAVPGLDDLRRTLGPLVHDERVERHEAPGLLASVYHLVPRGRGDDYRRALAATTLRLRVSGPFPPYAFAPPLA